MIVSYFFTFLCSENNEIFQKNICDFEVCGNDASENDLINHGYEVVPLHDDYVAFKKGDFFLSVLPDGAVSHAPCVKGWEQFRIIKDYIPMKVINLPQGKNISQQIHQTESLQYIRDIYFENIKNIKSLNDGWDYNFYSEKDRHDFIYNHFGWDILNIYMKIHPGYGASRADLFRYLCIYKSGGVYLDMKSGVERSFADIIRSDDHIILSQWDSKKSTQFHGWGRGSEILHVENGEFQQWFIIANSGNKLIKKVIDQVLSNIFFYDHNVHGVGRPAVLQVTGPYAFTRSIEKNLSNNRHRFIDSECEGIIYDNIGNYKKNTNYVNSETPLIL